MLQLTLSEILFYGGLFAAAAACVALAVCLTVCKLRAAKLETQLTAEYGPKKTR